MMIRGAAGVVSDGGLRDSMEIALLPFHDPMCAGPSAPTNLIKHHAVDLTYVPIGCGGVPGFPNDIIVERRRRRRRYPRQDRRKASRRKRPTKMVFETFVIEKVGREGASIVGLNPPNEATQKEYADWRAKRPKD